jgi:hypothetical protein
MAHTPISMRCTKEQFEEIKPILEANGCKIVDIDEFEVFVYLINCRYGMENIITNYQSKSLNSISVYEEWNAKIFLDACGITTEKERGITITHVKDMVETENQYDVASRIVIIFNRMQNGKLAPTSAGELIAEEIEAYAEMKVQANHKAEHGNTWDAAIKAHEDRGGNIARSWTDFEDYYNTTFKGGKHE